MLRVFDADVSIRDRRRVFEAEYRAPEYPLAQSDSRGIFILTATTDVLFPPALQLRILESRVNPGKRSAYRGNVANEFDE